MATLRQDFTYTLRRLSAAPGFVLAVVLSIGIGIATNATIFSIISRFVLQPPPVGDPATLLSLHTTHDGEECCNNFSMPTYIDVRDQARSFSGVAACDELVPASIGGKGEPERVWGQAATANYFDVARLGMTFGRGFLPSEEHQPVIVLGHRLWQRHFASDPNIIGKPITLSGHPYTVVGVAPLGFHGLDLILDPEFWVPLGNVAQLAPLGNIGKVDTDIDRGNHWLAVIGRLQPGVTTSQAAAELHTLAGHYATAYPKTDKGGGFLLTQAGSLPPRDHSTILMFLGILSVAVLLVLCIACANVANLLLAKGVARQREMAIRLALGAARTKLLRQMIMESILMALGGGLVGILLALWATGALSAFRVPAPVPLDVSVAVDWRVLLYTFVLSVATGLFLGLVPAWIASRPVLTSALKGEDAMARPGRRVNLRSILVVAQIAMSLVLLCGTGLLLRSLQNASSIDIGFRSRGLLRCRSIRACTATPRKEQRSSLRTEGTSSSFARSLVSCGHRLGSSLRRKSQRRLLRRRPASGARCTDRRSLHGYARLLRDSGHSPNPRSRLRTGVCHRAEGRRCQSGIRRAALPWTKPHRPSCQRRRCRLPDHRRRQKHQVAHHRRGHAAHPLPFACAEHRQRSILLGYQLIVRYQGESAAVANEVRSQIHVLDPAMAVYNCATGWSAAPSPALSSRTRRSGAPAAPRRSSAAR